ncbi:hypothetical protein HYPSUDRAFT_200566 [Hypholoma sublateritium FD-334 SS-4]|uniref:Uncharacterized protein n=1 Tax=Hypholoma sublateritium (strain FD-334 SS-4) TaxID=945553 RepID=A0A0D2MKR2_HYPSF|nr:hypothetical protein HYPSUDRAFT_200566 [Hypholoma sublateritium FD-334 SS-4]
MSGRAHAKTMRFMQPDQSETAVAAHFEYLCSLSGMQQLAYVPVVAIGPRICVGTSVAAWSAYKERGPLALAGGGPDFADTLSARMALQNYYMPLLGGVQHMLANASESGGNNTTTAAVAAAALAAVAGGGGKSSHLSLPFSDLEQHRHGNTKKRKVPANSTGSPRGGERLGSPLSYLDDDGNKLAGPEGESFGPQNEELLHERDRDREHDRDQDRDRDRDRDRDYELTPPLVYPPPPFPGQLAMLVNKRGKLTAVTLAGLQHKEMHKSRKRQLAAVMGALSHGDKLALDQALSTNYPLVGGLPGAAAGGMSSELGSLGLRGDLPAVRKSKRRMVRLARAMKVILEMPERRNRHPDAVPFPEAVIGRVLGHPCNFDISQGIHLLHGYTVE